MTEPAVIVSDSKTTDKLCDNEEDAGRLWAEIHRLRAAVAGPHGYASWQEAATAERVRRVKAERLLADVTPQVSLWQRFKAWRERTRFFMDNGIDGGM